MSCLSGNIGGSITILVWNTIKPYQSIISILFQHHISSIIWSILKAIYWKVCSLFNEHRWTMFSYYDINSKTWTACFLTECGYCAHIKCLNQITRMCASVRVQQDPTYNLSICAEKGLSAQNYRCAECRQPISFSMSGLS